MKWVTVAASSGSQPRARTPKTFYGFELLGAQVQLHGSRDSIISRSDGAACMPATLDTWGGLVHPQWNSSWNRTQLDYVLISNRLPLDLAWSKQEDVPLWGTNDEALASRLQRAYQEFLSWARARGIQQPSLIPSTLHLGITLNFKLYGCTSLYTLSYTNL